MTSCDATYNSYSTENLKFGLYDSLEQRNALFGYDYIHQGAMNKAYQNNFFVNTKASPQSQDISLAPRDYYFDLRTDNTQKAVIGWDDDTLRPSLYNDEVTPAVPSLSTPNFYRSGQPFSNNPTVAFPNVATTFWPHKNGPVEVAPNMNPKMWIANQNAMMYERKLVSGAEESFYSNNQRRQGLNQLINTLIRPSGSPYTVRIETPELSFANQLEQAKGRPPATTMLS